jgi:hypothetical protein
MHALTPAQIQFFETFGYLVLPGLLADVDTVTAAFEEVWSERGGGHAGAAHSGEARSCIVPFIDQHPRLCALLDDPGIEGAVASLLGADFNYVGSDGNYYAGDTQWHSDGWGEREGLRFLKVALYLDPLTRDTGCLRVIPGSHHVTDGFAQALQAEIGDCAGRWGVDGAGVPAVALETSPGDIAIFNHNLKHAAFGGSERRRMFTINCCTRAAEHQLAALRGYINVHSRFWIDRLYGETMMATAGPTRMVHLAQCREQDFELAALAADARRTMSEPSRG